MYNEYLVQLVKDHKAAIFISKLEQRKSSSKHQELLRYVFNRSPESIGYSLYFFLQNKKKFTIVEIYLIQKNWNIKIIK